MKKLLLILLTFTACQKATETPQRLLLIETDTMQVDYNQSARGGNGKKPVKPPTDTPPPTDNPPPTGTGYSCILVDFDGENVVSNFWNGGSSIPCLPSGLDADQRAQAIAEIRALYAAYNVFITED